MRVIAGSHGGRRLRAPRGDATRPTADRVRQAWFDVLEPVAGKRVADLYAGTGALGIEALSRGARQAVFVESSRPVLQLLEQNLSELGLGAHARVLPVPVERAGRALATHGPYDLVLCDPPWLELARAQRTLSGLPWPHLLTHAGLLCVEHPRDATLDVPPLLQAVDHRRWGAAAVTFWQLAATPAL